MKTVGKATDLITFSRSSGGTYLDSDGVLKTASADIPRIEYDANGNVLGLLIEESRTNLHTQSLVSGTYNLRMDVTRNLSGAPDGTETATLCVPNTTSGTHAFGHSLAYSSGTTDETYSVYLKAAGYTKVQLSLSNQAGGYAAVFDLDAGTATNSGALDETITDVGNGWYRCSMTFTSTKTNPYPSIVILDETGGTTFAGDGTSGIYAWGHQLEAGAFPTSYIPTSGSTATRAADVASIATSEFGYRDDEGTLVVEASIFDSDNGVSTAAYLGDNTTDYVNIYTQYGTYYRVGAEGNNVSNGNIVLNTGDPISSNSKVTTSWKNDSSFNAARDGVLGAGYTDFAPFTNTPNNLYIGSRTGSIVFLNGHIKSIKYIPRRLTNDQLQEITS